MPGRWESLSDARKGGLGLVAPSVSQQDAAQKQARAATVFLAELGGALGVVQGLVIRLLSRVSGGQQIVGALVRTMILNAFSKVSAACVG
jgi:hypothetical protein